jgi:hypothetical protein
MPARRGGSAARRCASSWVAVRTTGGPRPRVGPPPAPATGSPRSEPIPHSQASHGARHRPRAVSHGSGGGGGIRTHGGLAPTAVFKSAVERAPASVEVRDMCSVAGPCGGVFAGVATSRCYQVSHWRPSVRDRRSGTRGPTSECSRHAGNRAFENRPVGLQVIRARPSRRQGPPSSVAALRGSSWPERRQGGTPAHRRWVLQLPIRLTRGNDANDNGEAFRTAHECLLGRVQLNGIEAAAIPTGRFRPLTDGWTLPGFAAAPVADAGRRRLLAAYRGGITGTPSRAPRSLRLAAQTRRCSDR